MIQIGAKNPNFTYILIGSVSIGMTKQESNLGVIVDNSIKKCQKGVAFDKVNFMLGIIKKGLKQKLQIS